MVPVSVKAVKDWLSDDRVLEKGELARTLEFPECMKIGDGESKWSDLPYYKMYEDKLADETAAMFVDDERALMDRKLFVHNLGELLKQTREGIISVELDDNEIVTVTFKGGATKKINVHMDSYLAIIRDVTKYI